MEYDLTLLTAAMLAGTGFIAGFINTLAGGGSMLTLPALMILGMPADVANGTNRVGILLQSAAAAGRFRQMGKLDSGRFFPTLTPTLAGALPGALLASHMPVAWLKPVLLGTMIIMALVMVIRPAMMAPPPGTRVRSLKKCPLAWAGLFAAGFYGGFVQAGVGFILIAALAGGLCYDLVRANALKMAITAALSVVALSVFVLNEQVLWIPGLILAAGSVAGAVASVQFSVSIPHLLLRRLLFAIILMACVVALFS